MKRMAVTLTALTLLVASCGDDNSSSLVASLEETVTTTSSTTPQQAAADADEATLEYVQCLRVEGLEIQDPNLSEEASLGLRRQFAEPGEALPSDMEAAFDACDALRDGMTRRFEDVDMSDTEDRLLAFSQCMRDAGVLEFPDPDLSVWEPGAGLGPGNGPFGTAIFELEDSADGQAALVSCRAEFGGPGTGQAGGE